MFKLMDELDDGYRFSNESVDTTTKEGMKQYQVMANCIEQYRREMMQSLFIKHHIEPIIKDTQDKLGIGETHLHLKGTLQQRLQQILEYNL